MKYYIGYRNNLVYYPLFLDEDKTSLLSLIEYTSKYEDFYELLKVLHKKDNNINYDTDLCYLKAENKNDEYIYTPLTSYPCICYKNNKESYTRNGITKFIRININNLDFLESLYSFIIENSSVKAIIQNYISFTSDNNFEIIISVLKNYNITDELKDSIQDYLDHKISKDEVLSLILNNSNNLKQTYRFIKNLTDLESVPQFVIYMNNLIAKVKELCHKSKSDTIINNKEVKILVNKLVDRFIYKVNPDNRSEFVKLEDGSNKINQTALFKLGTFIDEYKDYLNHVNRKLVVKHIDSDFDDLVASILSDDEEEFLTAEDFLNIDLIPEENGYKKR